MLCHVRCEAHGRTTCRRASRPSVLQLASDRPFPPHKRFFLCCGGDRATARTRRLDGGSGLPNRIKRPHTAVGIRMGKQALRIPLGLARWMKQDWPRRLLRQQPCACCLQTASTHRGPADSQPNGGINCHRGGKRGRRYRISRSDAKPLRRLGNRRRMSGFPRLARLIGKLIRRSLGKSHSPAGQAQMGSL